MTAKMPVVKGDAIMITSAKRIKIVPRKMYLAEVRNAVKI